MSRFALLLIFLALLSLTAQAQSGASRLAKAHAELSGGSPAAALELLRELQVEQPNDERVRYALGCAQYKLAEAQAAVGATPGAAPGAPGAPPVTFDDAKQTFDGLAQADDASIARASAFNRANCLAQSAKQLLADPEKSADAQNGLRAAITAYEDLVHRYPEDASAKQNLDHVRYLLKKMQAESPEKQDQKDDKKSEDEQSKAMLSVRNAVTEIAGARAVVGEDSTVQLVQPGTSGAKP